MKIKHLVISGGAYYGFCIYGALRQLNSMDKYQNQNIETIYATSIGTVIACMIAMNYDWNTLDEYLIKRPWHHTFPMNINSIFNAYSNCGLYDKKFMESIMNPLLLGKNIDPNVTLSEFYDKTNVKMGFITTYADDVSKEILSHDTHPSLRLIDALYCSCCVPVIFKPEIMNNKVYIDGGITSNFPVDQSVNNGAKLDEILGIQIVGERHPKIHTDSLLDFLFSLLIIFIRKVIQVQNENQNKLDYCVSINKPNLSISGLYECISNEDIRKQLVEEGSDIAKNTFLDNTDNRDIKE